MYPRERYGHSCADDPRRNSPSNGSTRGRIRNPREREGRRKGLRGRRKLGSGIVAKDYGKGGRALAFLLYFQRETIYLDLDPIRA